MSKMSNGKFIGIWAPFLVLPLAFIIGTEVAGDYYKAFLDTNLGKGELVITKAEGTEEWDAEYYKGASSETSVTRKNGENKVEEICNEGIVLLKNDGTLPISTDKRITLLGRGSVDPVYGGSGSGNVDTTTCATPRSGLVKAGFSINEDAYNFFNSNFSNYPKANIAMDKYDQSQFFIGEIPTSAYTFTPSSSDVAVVVISRAGGEGGDLSTNLKRDAQTSTAQNTISSNANAANEVANYADDQHQLELTKEEKDVISYAKTNYSKTIVVINSSNTMELGELNNDAGVSGILWVGSAGSTGFNSLGSILAGTVNPSGRTPDIYPADFTKDPTFKNFALNGINQYSAIQTADDAPAGDSNRTHAHFVQYEEGIYIGYKYYETAAATGFINYDESVVYPFGYGLSYTTFSQEIVAKSTHNEHISVDVKVTNTGSVARKEVVQLYYSAPYINGGIEKASTNLGDFAKTKLLAPGESETVRVEIDVEEMASYDYKNEKAYVLDQGVYTIDIKNNSHEKARHADNDLSFTYNINSKIVLNKRNSDKVEVTNQFDDVSAIFKDTQTDGYALNMSRSNFNNTFPTAPTSADDNVDIKIDGDKTIRDYLKPYTVVNNEEDVMPTMGAQNGLSVIDIRAIDYDDESLDLLLDQLTEEDYNNASKLLGNQAYNTPAIESIGKPRTDDKDGPQGFSVLFGKKPDACAYMSEPLLAATFNKELAKSMGQTIGDEALALKFTGWYGPAMNTHRSPFAGRNFEYYSEDGVLGGKIAAEVVSGAADKGVASYIKHFALNDQESFRTVNLCTWANEQAIRETYLKPFEIVVKTAKTTINYIGDNEGTIMQKEMNAATAIMSSFNRLGATWAGGSKALMTNVLRDEWGFRGVGISDFNLYGYMFSDQGTRAGTDMQLSCSKPYADTTSATARIAIRKALKNMLYMTANSNAMNHVAPGTIISYTTSPWRIGLTIANITLGVLDAAGITWVVIRVLKNRKLKEE